MDFFKAPSLMVSGPPVGEPLAWLMALIRGRSAVSFNYNEAMPEESTSTVNFEARLEELERIVKELERGDLPLEESLKLFESGMKLSADCKRQLEEAETRVEILIKRGSEIVPA